jgi:hypothetical protein
MTLINRFLFIFFANQGSYSPFFSSSLGLQTSHILPYTLARKFYSFIQHTKLVNTLVVLDPLARCVDCLGEAVNDSEFY